MAFAPSSVNQVLTDYHLHLRPDDTGEVADYFTEENVERYLAAAEEHGIDELGVSEHVYRFSQSLELWRHPYWEESARDDLDAYVGFVRQTPLRLGIECDFVPGSEDRTAGLLDRDFDYVIGSIHFLGERGAVDDRRYDVWEAIGDPDELWSTYFRWQAELVRSGLFDVVFPPGPQFKIWGDDRPRPERDPRFHYEPFVEAIADTGIAVEVSTARAPQAGRRDLPGARPRRDVPGGRSRLRPVLGCARSGPGRIRVRPGPGAALRPRGRADLRLRRTPAEPRAARPPR